MSFRGAPRQCQNKVLAYELPAAVSRAIQNVLAQILDYTASANNEQRRSKTGSCELSRLGSSEATERLGLQSARAAMRKDMENSQSCLHELRTLHVFRGAPRQCQNEVLAYGLPAAESRAIQNVLAQILDYMANANNEHHQCMLVVYLQT